MSKEWSATVSKRLFARFKIAPSGCWEWMGPVASHGYGVMGINGHQTETVHRIAWQVANGPIPDGLWVLHTCDNRRCFNPLHLYLGTVKENARDAVERGRIVAKIRDYVTPEVEAYRVSRLPKGKSHHRSSAKLTPDMVKAVKEAVGSQRAIASSFGICQQQVSNIKRGKEWAWL